MFSEISEVVLGLECPWGSATTAFPKCVHVFPSDYIISTDARIPSLECLLTAPAWPLVTIQALSHSANIYLSAYYVRNTQAMGLQQ